MYERPACRRLASIAALAAGLWMAGCATTEAEGEGPPDLVTGIAILAGQIIGGVLMGAAGALGGQPQDTYGYGYRSPTYSTTAYTQTYAQPARSQHSHHHHNHSHRRR
jgi:hypothetical protein